MPISEKRKSQIAGISQNAIQSKSDQRKIAAEKSAPPPLLLGKVCRRIYCRPVPKEWPAMDSPRRNPGKKGDYRGLLGRHIP